MKLEEFEKQTFSNLINVSQLLREPVGSSRSYHARDVVGEKARDSIEGEVTLIGSGRGILVKGEMVVKVELTCSRCLDNFLYLVSFSMEEEFLPSTASSLAEEVSFTIDSNHMLDLGEAIWQYILLNLPMKPLCRFDCPGLKEFCLHGFT
jgi:uncharacterized protein